LGIFRKFPSPVRLADRLPFVPFSIIPKADEVYHLGVLWIAFITPLLVVSRQTINAIETGKFDPSLPLAFRAARSLRTAYRRNFS
jgi:hypothetical protein